MSAVADKLREARKLIERGWTQRAYARGRRREVFITSPAAQQFCALGAIGRATGTPIMPDATDEAVTLAQVLPEPHVSPFCDVIDWNDAPERTQDEVLAAFDKAIELAEREDAR